MNMLKKVNEKLNDFAGSSTAAKVQTSFRHSIENLVSSFRKAKLTYASWVKSRAQAREKNQYQIPKNFPWRWTFQRGYYGERVRHQTPNKEQVCYSKFYFPINKICSMKKLDGEILSIINSGILLHYILNFVLCEKTSD